VCVHQLTKCQYSSVYLLDIASEQSVCLSVCLSVTRVCVHQLTKCHYSSVYLLDIASEQSVCLSVCLSVTRVSVHQFTKCQYSSVYQLDISPDQSVCPPDSRRVGHALQLKACCRVTCILTPVLISSTVMRSSTSRFTACHHDMDNISTHCSVDSSNHFPFTAKQTDRQTDSRNSLRLSFCH